MVLTVTQTMVLGAAEEEIPAVVEDKAEVVVVLVVELAVDEVLRETVKTNMIAGPMAGARLIGTFWGVWRCTLWTLWLSERT